MAAAGILSLRQDDSSKAPSEGSSRDFELFLQAIANSSSASAFNIFGNGLGSIAVRKFLSKEILEDLGIQLVQVAIDLAVDAGVLGAGVALTPATFGLSFVAAVVLVFLLNPAIDSAMEAIGFDPSHKELTKQVRLLVSDINSRLVRGDPQVVQIYGRLRRMEVNDRSRMVRESCKGNADLMDTGGFLGLRHTLGLNINRRREAIRQLVQLGEIPKRPNAAREMTYSKPQGLSVAFHPEKVVPTSVALEEDRSQNRNYRPRRDKDANQIASSLLPKPVATYQPSTRRNRVEEYESRMRKKSEENSQQNELAVFGDTARAFPAPSAKCWARVSLRRGELAAITSGKSRGLQLAQTLEIVRDGRLVGSGEVLIADQEVSVLRVDRQVRRGDLVLLSHS